MSLLYVVPYVEWCSSLSSYDPLVLHLVGFMSGNAVAFNLALICQSLPTHCPGSGYVNEGRLFANAAHILEPVSPETSYSPSQRGPCTLRHCIQNILASHPSSYQRMTRQGGNFLSSLMFAYRPHLVCPSTVLMFFNPVGSNRFARHVRYLFHLPLNIFL